MSRIYVKIIFPLLIAFALLTVLIRAQGYDDQGLEGLLIPADCPMPCFLGIQPGVTRLDDAVRLLSESAWVKELRYEDDADETLFRRVLWDWSGAQPGAINGANNGILIYDARTERVEQIAVPTLLQAGQIHLLLGAPPFFAASTSRHRQRSSTLVVWEYYATRFFYTFAPTFCPLNISNFWRAGVAEIDFYRPALDFLSRGGGEGSVDINEYKRVC